jgi:hypothetical protein
MTVEAGSTVPRRQLGRYLRRAREEAGITREAASKELEWSVQKLWRIENGAISMRAIDVRNMAELYRVDHELTQGLMALARETKSRGWWHAYAVPSFFELYVGLEGAAHKIRAYEPELIPGLLQTREYIIAVTETMEPDLSPDDKEKRAAVKLERQELLRRRLPPAPSFDVIINEAALRRPLQDRNAMAVQLRHLVTVASELSNVTIRVLPLSAGIHAAAAAGAFAVLSFPNSGANPEPTTVYGEMPTGALYLDKPNEIARYHEIWNALDNVVLPYTESATLMKSLAKEYETS